MPRACSADTIRLSRGRRRRLVHLSHRQTAPVREVRRARILLLAAQRQSNAAIAAQVGCHVDTVRATRRDFRARGMKALRDRPRTGRPLTHGLDVRLLVAATATSEPPETDSQWTHQAIAERYTPWLNMVELFFSILARRLLRRGEFSSREHLARKLLNFIDHYSRHAKPFQWRYNGRPLTAA